MQMESGNFCSLTTSFQSEMAALPAVVLAAGSAMISSGHPVLQTAIMTHTEGS